MNALQVLEVVLASKNHMTSVRVGRSFFRKPKQFYDLSDCYEMYTGIYQAALLGEEPFFNVDIAHKSFPQAITILEVLDEKRISPQNTITDNRALNGLKQFLKGLRIIYDAPKCFGIEPRQYTVRNIGLPATKSMFTNTDGVKMSVHQYFNSRGYTIKYPHLNCLDVGSTTKSISLPMELCSVAPDQVLNVSCVIIINNSDRIFYKYILHTIHTVFIFKA